MLLFVSVVQLVQGQECKACYWGINNKTLSSSNTHIRIDCYLCFAFSFLWLLLHSSRECTAKWIGLSSNWYAANVLKYLCSNRFVPCLPCEHWGGWGELPSGICWGAEGQCTSSYLFSSHATTRATFKVQRYNPFHFHKSLQQEGKTDPAKPAVIGRG